MKDVTAVLSGHRKTARWLWNEKYLPLLPTAQDPWKLRDQFDNLSSATFTGLVLESLGLDSITNAARIRSASEAAPPTLLPWLHVVPVGDSGVPIMINRDRTADSGYWDHPIQQVKASEVALRFVGWFDFDELGVREFKYYLVRIVASPTHDLVGRAALIACDDTSVVLDESALPALAPSPFEPIAMTQCDWYYCDADKDAEKCEGPVPFDRLLELIRSGEVPHDVLISNNQADWREADTIEAILHALPIDRERIMSEFIEYGEAEDPDFGWASDRMYSILECAPELAWELIVELMERAPSDDSLSFFAASPLENLLSKDGPAFIERVERRAAESAKFRRAVGMLKRLGMTDDVWARVRAIAGRS